MTSSTSSTIQAVLTTYRKAPITLSLFASYFASQLISKLWLDYRLFIALPGGPLPKNILGWLVHYFALSPLSLNPSFTRGRLLRSYLPPAPNGAQKDTLSTGVKLPKRKGGRALTAGTIPHRQLDQFHDATEEADAEAKEAAIQEAQQALAHILSVLQKQADAQPSHLRLGPSLIEGSHSIALFAVSHTLVSEKGSVSRSTQSAQFPSALSRRFLSSIRGEFVHIHCPPDQKGEDGSLHMTLHPSDAALVVERGWGELHSLAGFPSYSGFWIGWPAWFTQLSGIGRGGARWWSKSSLPREEEKEKTGKAKGLPPTYCMIYSPRNGEEAKVVEDIIGAAIGFAIGSRPSR